MSLPAGTSGTGAAGLVIDYADRELRACGSLPRSDGSITLTVCPGGSADFLGSTTVFVEDGYIIAAKVSIFIGPDDPDWRQEFYPTIVHELGHAIGLNHNPDPNSVMYFDSTDNPYYIVSHDCDALQHFGYRPAELGCRSLASEPILWP